VSFVFLSLFAINFESTRIQFNLKIQGISRNMKFKYYFTIISILGLKFVKSFEEHECGTVKTSIETLYRIHNGQESTKFQSPW
jgi:hypothetical protein